MAINNPVSDGDLALMRRIDELHLDYPFAGSRMLQGLLRGEGLETGRRHVATLMKKMGIKAIYRFEMARTGRLGKVHTAYAHIAPWDDAYMKHDWLPAEPEPPTATARLTVRKERGNALRRRASQVTLRTDADEIEVPYADDERFARELVGMGADVVEFAGQIVDEREVGE